MRKLLKNLRFVIIAVVAFTGVASPLLAETWECVVDKAKRQDRLPSSVTIQVNAETGEILEMDDLSKSWGRPVVVGRMITDNAKRQTIGWSVEGVDRRFESGPNFRVSEVSFKATINKSEQKLKIMSRPRTGGDYAKFEQISKGSCRKK